jgi:hypothetical protein
MSSDSCVLTSAPTVRTNSYQHLVLVLQEFWMTFRGCGNRRRELVYYWIMLRYGGYCLDRRQHVWLVRFHGQDGGRTRQEDDDKDEAY